MAQQATTRQVVAEAAYVYDGPLTVRQVIGEVAYEQRGLGQETRARQVLAEVAWIPMTGDLYALGNDLGDYEGDERGVPLSSDRSAWDDVAHPEVHARDLKDGHSIHHLPASPSDGDAALWDATLGEWLPADVLTPAEHTAIGDGAPHHARAHNLDSDDDHPDVDPTAKADGRVLVWRDMAGRHVYEEQAAVTLGNTGLSLSGQQLSLRLATVSGLSISSGLRLDDSVAGDGLAIANKVLAVGAGDGIDVSANAIAVDVTDLIGSGLVEEATNNIALNTPGTLSVSSPNAAAGNHTHAVTASSNPGAAARILASNATGYLQLRRIGLGTAPSYPLHVSGSTQQARFDYNTSNYLSVTVGSDGSTLLSTATGASGGNLTLAPVGDVIFNPTGNDLLPLTGYDLNIGSLQKKYLTLHCAELWVETLVAHDTIATIGGRILVGPTTELTADLASGAGAMYVKHNEMRYGDRAYLEANGQVEFIGILAYVIRAVSVAENWIKIADDQTAYFPASTPLTIRGSTGNDGNWLCTASEYIAGENRTKITIDGGPASAVADGHILHTGQPGAGPYRYVIQRNLDGSGANDWYAGDAVFNTGTTGDGFIDLYSVAAVKGGIQYGPTIVGNVRNSGTYNDWSEHWAIGNLSGLYGYGATAYGFAAGKYANNQSFVTVDATNGVRMLHKNAGGTDITLAQWAVDGVLTIGEVANERNNVRIASGALSIRNNTTERIGLTAAGVLTIKDSSGAAVITLDASAGAEITKKLTMPGANSAIAIGATPPTSASAGTGLWLDRTGLYGLAANVVQAKMDATTGAIVAAAGKTVMDVNGVTLDADTVAGTGAAYSEPGTALKWMRAGTSTKVGSVYGNWNATLGVGALVLDAQYDASNRAAIALYGTVAGAYIRLSGLVSMNGGLNVTGALNATGGLNVGTATGAAAGSILASGGIGANIGYAPGDGDINAGRYLRTDGDRVMFNDSNWLRRNGTHIEWWNGSTYVQLD